jgi:hypothetical protein
LSIEVLLECQHLAIANPFIWPPHCLLDSFGNQVFLLHAYGMEVAHHHPKKNMLMAWFLLKGHQKEGKFWMS